MNTRFSHIVTVAAAFTAGICTGLMLAPESGKGLRKRMATDARLQLKTAEEKLEKVESQLASVNNRIQQAGKALGDKMRDAMKDVADEIIPDLSTDDAWDLTKDEVAKELRHLSRG